VHRHAQVVDARQRRQRARLQARAGETRVAITHAAHLAIALVVEAVGESIAILVDTVRARLLDLRRRFTDLGLRITAARDEPQRCNYI
jgi:hypothetical protein